MRWPISIFGLALITLVLVAGTETARAEGSLGTPVRVEAAGEPINTVTGHAAPYVHDWDGDGIWDLLVGQMGSGQLRIYRNLGTADAPRFGDFELFKAGESEGTVPAG